MGNIDDIYRYIKERSKEIKEQNKDLPAYVYGPYLETAGTIYNGKKLDSKYNIKEIDNSYYTTFNINKDLKNE